MKIEITGCYPIILDGETVGEITITREGVFWSFDAKCEMRDEIVRLSVYGDGKEGYLGIMEPFGEVLRLTKKFSRNALNEFPTSISHAGEKGEVHSLEVEAHTSRPAPVETPQYSGEFPRNYYLREDTPPVVPPEDDKPPPFVLLSPHSEIGELDWRPCPMPCSLFSGVSEKKVCSNITGAFLARDGENHLLAVPEDIAQTLPASSAICFIDKIIICDNIYLICKIYQGKPVSEL